VVPNEPVIMTAGLEKRAMFPQCNIQVCIAVTHRFYSMGPVKVCAPTTNTPPKKSNIPSNSCWPLGFIMIGGSAVAGEADVSWLAVCVSAACCCWPCRYYDMLFWLWCKALRRC
jgi:hypothetical protein